jgi:PAS domain S-box-containing protein
MAGPREPRKKKAAPRAADDLRRADRERAENALRDSEERHKEMIANITDVIALMAVAGTLRYKSANIEQHFGWLPDDLLGTTGGKRSVLTTWSAYRGKLLALLDKVDSVATMDYRCKCKDGSYRMIDLTATNLTNSPLVNGVLMSFHDSTARKHAEQSVRVSEQRLLGAQGIARVGSWELDLRPWTMWASNLQAGPAQ